MYKVARLFITISNKPSATHPLMLITETDAPLTGRAKFLKSEEEQWREQWGVQMRDMSQAYCYANGVNAGLNAAGLDSTPIVVDPRLTLPTL